MNDQQDKQNDQTMAARYQRAKTLMEGFLSKSLVQNDAIFPTWIDQNHFWYERSIKSTKHSTGIGKEFRVVDAQSLSNLVAFDHASLALALASATNETVEGDNLPISHISFNLEPLIVRFTAFEQCWQYNNDEQCCHKLDVSPAKATDAFSPDGKQCAFIRDYNLWLRNEDSGEEHALTTDGEEDYAYGDCYTAWGTPGVKEGCGLWSSDSVQLLSVVRDKRQVKSLPCVNHVPLDGSIRPTLQQVKVAYPGDEQVETFQMLSINVTSGESCLAKHPPCVANYNQYCGFFGIVTWRSSDDKHAYFIDAERGDQVFRLIEMNTQTGATRELFKETSSTYINLAGGSIGVPLHRYLTTTNELIWWSERSGWGHLYLYDLTTGVLKHTITCGEWRVRNVLAVDEQRREILIQTSGRVPERDPYYRDVCRVNIDTGDITTLLSSDAEIIVCHPNTLYIKASSVGGSVNKDTGGISPDGDYIVATRSRVDQGSDSFLVNREGDELLKLEKTDLSRLPNHWQWPEPIQVEAADGKTPLYGTLFRPSDFSPDQKYPIINFLSAGPWLSNVPKASFHSASEYPDRHYFYGAALAELGFIVLVLDTRGTASRSKTFQDESYGWVPSAGNTDDFACALTQLIERYPYMDKNRIGIFGQGYRSGLQNFLERQDIYKVGVLMGLLDDRLTVAFVGEKYEGVDGPKTGKLYPEQLVNNLQGKLLLMNSMSASLSPSYPPASTFRVVGALQKANKDFDMLTAPHGGDFCDSYMFRRAFDYLVKHLMGNEPPKEFLLNEVNM